MPYNVVMSWKVKLSGKAVKQFEKLPEHAQLALRALVAEIQAMGPTERIGSTTRLSKTKRADITAIWWEDDQRT
jgi:mRNA-degrading endonuclease RelE of RelBE toxin-antitoxin system